MVQNISRIITLLYYDIGLVLTMTEIDTIVTTSRTESYKITLTVRKYICWDLVGV